MEACALNVTIACESIASSNRHLSGLSMDADAVISVILGTGSFISSNVSREGSLAVI